MATKKRKRRRSHSHSVSAPRKRRRRVGASPSVIGSPRKRKRHSIHGRKLKRGKRRRMGATGGGTGEFIGLLLGTGVGLFTAEIGGRMIRSATGPGTGTDVGLAIGKIATGAAIFGVGHALMKDNSFVKGVGIGFGGSAANDGFRALQGAGVISGAGDVVIEIKDRNYHQLKPANNSSNGAVSGASPSVIGDQEEWHHAHVLTA